jgi:hypothetical protein
MCDDKFYEVLTAAYLKQTAWTRLRLAQVKRIVDPQPGDKIIDLGCGMWGRWRISARRLGRRS